MGTDVGDAGAGLEAQVETGRPQQKDPSPRRVSDKRLNTQVPARSNVRAQAAERRSGSADDHALVARCKQGDEAAFRTLVERYQRRIYVLAVGMVHDQHDAQDITQEAFIKVHRYLDNFQGSASFYTWLYRITYNLCIDHLRRSGRLQTVDYDDRIRREPAADPGGLLPAQLEANPAKVVGRKELLDRIREAVDALPPYHRGVIIMREIEGMSYKEMAAAMKVSKGTIMSRLHHARHKLQKALAPYLEGDLEVK
jgi:RNA polymerase sigma-70 factor (ECF subfamily)